MNTQVKNRIRKAMISAAFVKKACLLFLFASFGVSLSAQTQNTTTNVFGVDRVTSDTLGLGANGKRWKVVMIGASSVENGNGVCMAADAPNNNLSSPRKTQINGQNASSADVTEEMLGGKCGAKVAKAFLYWGGSRGHNMSTASYPYWNDIIQIKKPGGAFQNVTAQYWGIPINSTDGDNRTPYYAFADVTAQLVNSGTGTFTVKDIDFRTVSGTEGGTIGGWNLILFYEDDGFPLLSDFTLKEGIIWSDPGTKTFNVTGLSVPATGDISAVFGIAAMDGDVNDGTSKTEVLKIQFNNGGTQQNLNTLRGVTDFLNSSMSYNGEQFTKYPDCYNTLGYDAHHITMPDGSVRNNATAATITYTQGSEEKSAYPFMTYLGIIKNQPDLRVTKVSSASAVAFGDTYQYMVILENIGGRATAAGTANMITLNDTLDYNIIFSGSIADITVKVNNVVQIYNTQSNITWNDATRALELRSLPQIPKDGNMVITYKVTVPDASHTELWRMSCLQEIYNKAWVNYYDDGVSPAKQFTAASGQDGCLAGDYTVTPILADFDAFDVADNGVKVITAADFGNLNTTAKIKTFLRDALAVHLGNAVGIADFTDGNITKVSGGVQTAFPTAINAGNVGTYTNTNGDYRLTRTVPVHPGKTTGACTETYIIRLLYCDNNGVVLQADKTDAVCQGTLSGTVLATAGGTKTDPIIYTLAQGTLANSAALTAGNTVATSGEKSDDTHLFEGLSPGNYTVIAIDAVGCEQVQPFTIADAAPMTLDLNSTTACIGERIQFTAVPGGGALGTDYGMKWYRSGDGGATFVAVEQQNDPLTYSVTSQSTMVLMKAEAYSLTAECTDIYCAAEKQLSVTLSQTPDLSAAAIAPICAGQTVNISITDAKAQTITSRVWKQSADSITWTTIDATGANYTTPALSGTVYYRSIWTAAGGCADSIDVAVTVNPQPIIANKTAVICSGETFTVTPANTLPDIVPVGTAYTWSAPSIAGITGTAAGTDESSISGTLDNTTSSDIIVTYVVTPKIGSCTGTSFNVAVTVRAKPQINAITRTVCSGTAFNATPIDGTDGIVPANTTYTWTVPTDNTHLDESAQAVAQTTIGQTLSVQNAATAQQTATYEVTPISGTVPNTCAGTPFTVTVNVNPLPTAAISTTAGGAICEGSPFQLTSTSANGTIAWTTTGTGTFSSTTTDSPTYTPSAADAALGTVTLTKTVTSNASPACTPAAVATYILTVNKLPEAAITTTAGGAICEGSPFQLTSTSANGTVAWTSSGSGTFSSTITDSPTYTPSAADAAAGTVTLTKTVSSNTTPVCTPAAEDTYVLTVNSLPEVAITTTAGGAICEGSPFQLTSTSANGTIAWTSSGTGAFSSTITDSPTYTPSAADAALGTVTLTKTVTSNAIPVCTEAKDTYDLIVTADMTVTAASSTPTLCINTALTTDITHTTTGATGISDAGVAGANGLPAGVSASWAADVITISGTPTIDGTFNYTIPLTGGCGTANATGTITVNPTPTIIGADEVCAGETITLTGAPTVGTKAWASSATGVATVTNGVVSGLTAGTTEITYTVDGCVSAAKEVEVRVCTDLVLTQTLTDDAICKDGTTTLTLTVANRAAVQAENITVNVALPAGVTATGAGYSAGNWTIVSIAAGGNAAITLTLTGSSIVTAGDIQSYIALANNGTITNANWGAAPADQKGDDKITVRPLPTAVISGTTMICKNESPDLKVDFTAGTAPFTFEYNDETSDITASNITDNPYSFSVSPTSSTIYTLVSLVDNYGCAATSGGLTGSAVVTVDDVAPVLSGTQPAGTTGINACYVDASTFPAGVPTFASIKSMIEAEFNDALNNPVAATETNRSISLNDCDWTVTYTYKVADACGNELGNQTITYTGSDQTAPTLTGTAPTGDTGINACYVDASTAPTGVPTFATIKSTIEAAYEDNCGAAVTATETDFAVSGNNCNWTATYTYKVSDACGNELTGQTITYSGSDQIKPTLKATAPTGGTGINACYVDASTAPSGVPTFAAIKSTLEAAYQDNCGGAVTATETSFAVSGNHCAWTATYTYKVSDACGNELTGQTIAYSGSDQTAPTLTGTAPTGTTGINACYVDASTAPASVPAFATIKSTLEAAYQDNCGGAVTATETSFAVSGNNCNWTAIYTYKVSDACSNELTAQTITYSGSDQTAPTFGLSASTANADASAGNCTFKVPDLSSLLINKDDNCTAVAGLTYTQTPVAGSVMTTQETVSITLTDACGNVSAAQTVTVTIPTTLTASNAVSNPSCANDKASAAVTISGGTSPYQYSLNGVDSWLSITNGGSISNLDADYPNATIKDVNGCTAATAIDVTMVTAITADLSNSDVSTPGGSDGSISINNVAGGKAATAIEYRITGTETEGGATVNRTYNASLTGLKAGSYTVYARNVGQTCEYLIGAVTIDEPGAIKGTATPTATTCKGDSDGSLSVTVTEGGTAPYEVILEKTDGTPVDSETNVAVTTAVSFTGLPSADYRVRVKDANGAEKTIVSSVTVGQPDVVAVSLVTASSTMRVSCKGASDGTIVMSATGGSATYTYSIDNGATFASSATFGTLSADNYNLIAKDDKGCLSAAVPVSITEPDALQITDITVSNPECNSGTASIAVTVSGGTAPYHYSLTGAAPFTPIVSGGSISGLTAGGTVTIRDDKACETSGAYTVTIPTAVVATKVNQTDLTCPGDTNGEIEMSATGGSSSYTYSKDNGATFQASATFGNLQAGAYNLVAKDNKGCLSAAVPVTIPVPVDTEKPVISTTVPNTQADDDGNCHFFVPDVIAAVKAISSDNCTSQANLVITQIPVANTPITSNTTVSVTVKDAAGNDTTATINIIIPGAPTLNFPSINPVCVNDAAITLTATNDASVTGTFSGTGVSGTSFNPAEAGEGIHTITYEVKLGSCTYKDTEDIQVYGLPIAHVTATPTCPGEPVIFKATGGSTYQWTVDGTPESVTGDTYTYSGATVSGQQITASVYAVSAVAQGSCLSDNPATKTATVHTIPAVLGSLTHNYCMGEGTVNVTSLMSASNGGSLVWYANIGGGGTITPQAVNKNETGITSFFVAARSAGASACLSPIEQVDVIINELPVIIGIDASNTGNSTIEIAGGTEPYTYVLDGGSGRLTGALLDLGYLSFGKHTVQIIDDNTCIAETSLYINEIELMPDKFFTPNGDGENDRWYITNIEFYPESQVIIHDRYGKELASCTAAEFVRNRGWDGTYLNKPMPATDYWYVIKVHETGKRLTGHFLLKR